MSAAVATLMSAAALMVGGCPGCSRPSDRQGFPGNCAPLLLVSSSPADGAQGVPVDADISLTFTDFPAPETVDLDSVILSSGVQTRLGSFQVDLLTRSIRFRTRNSLYPDLTYLLTVFPTVRSLTGCAAEAVQLRFHTSQGPTDPPPPPPQVPVFAQVLPILAARCAGAGCHRQTPEEGGGCLPTPPKGLSLCDQDAWSALVDADATEVSGMKRVVAGDASRSFLMRKLVAGYDGGPVPTTPGHRDPPGLPLPDGVLRLISDWIDGGAKR
ncbi:MAG TPA: Ig-like domain-containing protein [Polyangia bacterium]|jgi:hypothetical protein|nr:Ig-like domain-containing protein [Polyangia bacterium]